MTDMIDKRITKQTLASIMQFSTVLESDGGVRQQLTLKGQRLGTVRYKKNRPIEYWTKSESNKKTAASTDQAITKIAVAAGYIIEEPA